MRYRQDADLTTVGEPSANVSKLSPTVDTTKGGRTGARNGTWPCNLA